MEIVKVDATNSTNQLAKELNSKNSYGNFCVSAEFQKEGRGQQLSKWQSEKSKNLTFTIVYNQQNLDIRNQFMLNILVCLNIYRVLETYKIDHLYLKWPNDILADDKKICGILIENSLSGNTIKTSYVGIGLNVNQSHFEDLPHASSILNILGRPVNRDLLLDKLVQQLQNIPDELQQMDLVSVLDEYKHKLFRYDQTSDFYLNNKIIQGQITNIETDGRLVVAFTDGSEGRFQHKEIRQKL
jgi:BirA family biotin operon repressor/biotin-[acetyl-CoA-carboxylase] ligase